MTALSPRGTRFLTTEQCAFCGARDVWREADGTLKCACCGRREDQLRDLMRAERRRGAGDRPSS